MAHNKETSGALKVGLGITALAAAAGAYFLYGTKEGRKHRDNVKGWMLKAKGDILERIEELKDSSQEAYDSIVDTVAAQYKGVKNVDPAELKALVDDVKGHWQKIKKQIESIDGKKKTASKGRKAKKADTSWGGVADWYAEHLGTNPDSYQAQVILPQLLRLIAPPGKHILDLACGEGYFSRAFFEAGAVVSGLDISPELIEIARGTSPKGIVFDVASAEYIPTIPSDSMDVVVIVLAIQNIKDVKAVFSESFRVLRQSGRLYIVMNHPAFRIPRGSSWGFDETTNTQYRRIDRYMTEDSFEIDMHPGSRKGPKTISFHRPLQYYFKLLGNTGFSVSRLEEWISHKKSGEGPREKAENQARKEFPLFLCLEAIKGYR